MTPLEQALEHPANTPRAVLLDHGVRIVGDRCACWWYGKGLDLNVTVYPDHITHHTGGFRVQRILTELFDYSDDEARRYLLTRAGLSADAPQTRRPFTPKVAPPRPRETLKATDALARWGKLSTTGSSLYLARKGVQGVAAACSAVRYGRGFVAVRMSRITEHATLEPVSVQTIFDNGPKLFAAGGSTRGAVALVGADDLAAAIKTGRVYLAEGLATALTVHQATGAPVLACFSAGSLGPVAKSLRALEPDRKKLSLVIAGDNDRFNEPEAGNAGLEQAHRAALTYRCTVCSPVFADLTDRPTDFNDLHNLEGLEAVRAQLAAPANPDPARAFAPEQRRREQLLTRRGASRGRYVPAQNFEPGATVLAAHHGGGKTEVARPAVDAALAAGQRVLYISHSAALAETAARRLGLETYSDNMLRQYLTAQPGLSICLNSVPRLLENGILAAFDLVIIDESEQLARALTGSHIANRSGVLEALTLLLQRAVRVIALDADAGPLTRELLEQARPGEHISCRTHDYPVGQGRTMRVHDSKNGVYAAVGEFSGPALVMTNGKHEAEALGAHLSAQGKRVRVLTGDHADDDADFMRDIEGNARAEQLEALVCSPTVRTGVSLDQGYFRHVCGLFYGTVGTPEDALQALWRVRTACTYDLWLDPAVRTERLDLAAKYGRLTPKTPTEAGYNRLKYRVELTEQRAQAFYRLNFLQRAALQGFAFELVDADPAHKGLATAARRLADGLHYDRVSAAQELESDKAGELRRRLEAGGYVPQDDRDALERYRVSNFYKLGGDDDLRAALELDRRGRYQGQLERLELAVDTPENVLARAVAEAERNPLEADRRPVAVRHEFHSRALQGLGFGFRADLVVTGKLDQLELPRYDAGALESFRLWIEHNRPRLLGAVVLPDPARLKANLLRYVGSWLKVLGLKQKRVGKAEEGTYALELGSLKSAYTTLKRRGNSFLVKSVQEKSVPGDSGRSPAPPPAPPDLAALLAEGRLDAFGPQKVATIRRHLEAGDTPWLHQLASSRDFGRALGAI